MNEKLKNEELERLQLDEFKRTEKNKIFVVLDNVRSLNNVGSVFRTCDAFLIEELLLCGITGKPPQKEIEKTALGATESVNWQHFNSTSEAIRFLKEKKVRIFAVEQTKNSLNLKDFKATDEAIAVVFGNEIYGVEQEVIDLCDGVIEIPQAGTKHSFNIAVSAGIVLWEILKDKLP